MNQSITYCAIAVGRITPALAHRFVWLIIACCCVAMASCEMTTLKTDPATNSATLTDAQIFAAAQQTSGYVWYKNSDAYLGKTAKSGHGEPLMRTRYNAVAATLLDANGKVREGARFPEGSIITKELVNADRSLSGYAVMWKRTANDANADADGWVWGYVTASGSVRASVTTKGSGCIACHSIAGHIDRTLMNVSVP